MRRLAPLLTAIVVAALAGCSAAPTEAESPRPTPAPSSSAPAVESAPEDPTPESVFDASCADIATAADFRATSGVTLSATDWISTSLAASGHLPHPVLVRQLGGLSCEWGNGAAYSQPAGPGDWSGVRIEALPDAVAGYEQYLAYYGAESASGLTCTGGSCGGVRLVGTTWVSVESSGVEPDAVRAAMERTAQAVSAGPDRDPWSPPSGTLALTPSCGALIDPAAAAAILGVDDEVYPDTWAGGWSLYATAVQQSNAPRCSAMNETGTASFTVWGATGGAWAWEQYLPGLGGTPVRVTGLDSSDAALQRCGEWSCQIDVRVAHSWIQVIVPRTSDGTVTLDQQQLDQRLLALAEMIVANVRG